MILSNKDYIRPIKSDRIIEISHKSNTGKLICLDLSKAFDTGNFRAKFDAGNLSDTMEKKTFNTVITRLVLARRDYNQFDYNGKGELSVWRILLVIFHQSTT